MYIKQNIFLVLISALALLCLNCNAVKLHAESSRLLFVTIPFQSHTNVLIAIAQSLPIHHHITFAVFEEYIEFVHNKLSYYRPVTILSLGSENDFLESVLTSDENSNLLFLTRAGLPRIFQFYLPTHNALYKHLQIHSYDMMIVDMLAFAGQDLAHDLNIPMVISCVFGHFGITNLPAWIPQDMYALTQQELRHSFFTCFYNDIVGKFSFIMHMRSHMIILNRVRHTLNRTVSSNIFGFSNYVEHLYGHPILVHYPLAFEFRHKYTPNYHFIGFVGDIQQIDQMNNTKEILSVDKWLNETQISNEFVVLVAFGTLAHLHDRIWKMIIETLALIPNMRLLLAIPQENIRVKIQTLFTSSINDQSSRVIMVPWIAQQHVLTHPAIRMFVNHGGINSIGESIYAHKPLLILPGFGDQFSTAARVTESEIGHFLYRHTLTSIQLAEKIKLINNKYDYYVKNLIRLHQLNELEGGGAQKAAKLIDGWLLTGYEHLDTLEHHLPFLVATSLDVRLTFFLLLIIIIYIFFRLFKSLVLLYFSHQHSKLKQA